MIKLTYKELLLLYFLSLFRKNISGRKRIQKIFYLLMKKYNQPIPFQYKLHYYGPFSRDLHETLMTLVDSNLVNQDIQDLGDRRLYQYAITRQGDFFLKVSYDELDKNILRKVDLIVNETRYRSTDSIVNEVYDLAGIKK